MIPALRKRSLLCLRTGLPWLEPVLRASDRLCVSPWPQASDRGGRRASSPPHALRPSYTWVSVWSCFLGESNTIFGDVIAFLWIWWSPPTHLSGPPQSISSSWDEPDERPCTIKKTHTHMLQTYAWPRFLVYTFFSAPARVPLKAINGLLNWTLQLSLTSKIWMCVPKDLWT